MTASSPLLSAPTTTGPSAPTDPSPATGHAPLISCVICVHNAAPTLPRCLSSVSTQSLDDFEVILIDDGSDDGSGDICDRQAHDDPRFRVVHQENHGLQASRRTGLGLCRGRYVQFTDADDWLEPQAFERLARTAEDRHADLVLCSAWRYRADGITAICNIPLPEGDYSVHDLLGPWIKPLYGDLREDRLVTTGYLWPCLFRRTCLESVRFYPSIVMHEDEVILLQTLHRAQKITILRDCLYNYSRLAPDSMSKRTTYWPGYWDNMWQVFCAKRRSAHFYFTNEDEYLPRMETWLLQKLLRSIRNETGWQNPAGFWGGLRNVRHFTHLGSVMAGKMWRYYDPSQFTRFENITIRLLRHRHFLVCYTLWAIVCGRMRTYKEKTKN